MISVELHAALTVLAIIGSFCCGYVWGNRRELYWREKWIELEHDTAREAGREPRNISVVEPK